MTEEERWLPLESNPEVFLLCFYRDNDERPEEKLPFAGDELVPEETRSP